MRRTELKELWQKRMNDYETSKLSGTEWCIDQEIPLSQFRYWRRKLRVTQLSQPTDQWMSIELETQAVHAPLFIHCGFAKVEVHAGFDPDLFADVLRVLRTL